MIFVAQRKHKSDPVKIAPVVLLQGNDFNQNSSRKDYEIAVSALDLRVSEMPGASQKIRSCEPRHLRFNQ
jgi:hypothetical protein